MRFFALWVACVGIAMTAAGCDPVAERRYFTEGAGVDFYTADRASQVELLQQYIKFVCDQAGPDCGGNWTVFVQAGMNDIDQRCDGFLTWLDARRRDKEPILAELSALNTTAHTIMAISGASPKSLDIVTAAFGLATATYNNWNSRLLIAINQSTVQDVVYSSQGQYRDKIKNFPINDQPTAIYLLRNYLRLCMPTTIEANINTSSTLVQSGNATSATYSTVVKSVTATPTIRHRVNFDPGKTGDLINKFIHPDGVLKPRDPVLTKKVTDFMAKNDVKVSLTSFLRSPEFEDKRTVLARELGLIQ